MNLKQYEIECNITAVYGYAYYASGIRLISRLYIKNLSKQDLIDAELSINSADFIIPYKKVINIIPYESTIDIDVTNLSINPQILIDIKEKTQISIEIELKKDTTICKYNALISLLPYDMCYGTEVYPELISCFVNPYSPQLQKLLKSTSDIIKGWKLSRLLQGYEQNDKNSIRLITAALYRVIQQKNIELYPEIVDVEKPFSIKNIDNILLTKKASLPEMAIIFTSALESAGLNCILATGKNTLLAGVWLKDNCFLESSFDDFTELKKRSDELINDIVVIDVKKMFFDNGQNFSSAEKSAADILNENIINYVIDIKRCRIANYKPLPNREQDGKSYKLIEHKTQSLDDMPKANKKNIRPIKMKPLPSKESQWERRLLDLSLRNGLLNFIPKKNMLQIMSVSLEKTVKALYSDNEYSLLEMPSEFFSGITNSGDFDTPRKIKPLHNLINLEQKNNRLRTFYDKSSLKNSVSLLYRKEKILTEETGTSALYAACGFLKWKYLKDKDNYKYAPLILIPVSLVKKAGGKGYGLKLREEEIQFNTTLAEFIKQDFGIEMRGIENIQYTDILSILAAVKKQILGYKGWEITEDVYIASLSFTRYLMWNDIRLNIDTFKKNKIVNSLIQNKLDETLKKTKYLNKEYSNVFLPLTSDESQYKAVSISDKKTSFILHGPPGTGKSQTITNIIANALAKNKRVLFVAEKQAALSVVKKRLDQIGLGDFCLELYSNKSSKTEIVEKLYKTSQLSTDNDSNYKAKLNELNELKKTIAMPIEALHKKRQLGLSIYEGILNTKKYENAPDVLNIDTLFYEKLTPEKLYSYQNLLSELVSVNNECGGLYRSPFENSNITEYDETLKPNIVTSVQILYEEARHLKSYIKMCLDILGGQIRVVTKSKLLMIKDFCIMITRQNNPYKKLFESVKGISAVKVLNVFVSVYKDFEKKEKEYNNIFKNKLILPASVKDLSEELEKFPLDFYKSKPLKMLIKRMNRATKQKIRPEHIREYIDIVLDYNKQKAETAKAGEDLSKILGEKNKVNYNQVAEFILGLDKLYNCVSKMFLHYDRITFNIMLENIFTKYPEQIFKGFLNAYENFEKSRQYFFDLLQIDNDYKNIGEDYTQFISLKAAAVKDNIDMLDSWCRYNNISKKLKAEGLDFVLTPLKEGKVTGQEILCCFYKKVYNDFVNKEIAEDKVLSKFSSAVIEEKIEKLKILTEEFENITRKEIRLKLIQRLPNLSTEGRLSVELMQLQRAYKSKMRGITVRNIIFDLKKLFGLLAPCMLMSPGAVAKYLDAEENFDLVVFDEASQIPTAEAIGSIARAKNAVIVGDPKQLPPTTFFSADYTDEENLQYEDLESILEDCLALGLPEMYLKWHYRSKHESLIAFSNTLYYGNRLCTFPSTDSLQSKVKLVFVENGVYDRGRTKQNTTEADMLVAEVIKRLKADKGKGKSIGIVTFSVSQQTLIENKLSDALINNKLETAAYEREEPVFVKNLENVQGDERDIILFSVCYGPDKQGKLSLNFGPVNQANGWRRLNVAASRAREEMIVFSSITSAMIDLSRNNSKGVAGIKAFLEFAGNGKSMLAVKSTYVENTSKNIGKFIAEDLEKLGYECRYNLGVSDFKIDVAVLDKKTKKFILAIMCDSRSQSVEDIKGETVLQIKTLKRLNWAVYRLWILNYINNPKREIKKIKQYLDKIEGVTKTKSVNKYEKPYIEADIETEKMLSYNIMDKANTNQIIDKLKLIIKTEQPISKDYLIKKCLLSFGITRTGSRIKQRMEELLDSIECDKTEIENITFYYNDEKIKDCDFYRIDDDNKLKRTAIDISPYEYIAAAKSILEDRVSLYMPDIVKETTQIFKLGRVNAENEKIIRKALKFGNKKGYITISVNSMVTI